MSDLEKIIELSERQATALERIAAALELGNYQRAFPPNVTVNPIPPYPYGPAGPNQWPNTYGGQARDDGTITVTFSGEQSETHGGARG